MTDKRGPGSGDGEKASIHYRRSKVEVSQFPRVPDDFSWYAQYEDLLPRVLKGNDLRALTDGVARARAAGKPVILMLGAHVVKCGMGPLLGHLVTRGAVTGVAMNGACAIHDVEIAMWGRTSEDVASALEEGTFGMSQETAEFMNGAALRSLHEKTGLGAAVLETLADARPPHGEASLLMACGHRNRHRPRAPRGGRQGHRARHHVRFPQVLGLDSGSRRRSGH